MLGLYTLLSSGVFPIGAFEVGFVSEHRGVSRALLVNGAAGLIALATLLLARRRTLRAQRAS